MQKTEQTPDTNLVTLKTLWGAFLAIQFVYWFVLEYVLDKPEIYEQIPELPNFPEAVKFILPALSILAAFYLFNKMIKLIKVKYSNKNINSCSETELCNSYLTPFIVFLALIETCCIYGFIFSVLSLNPIYFYICFPVSLVFHLYKYPSLDKIKEALKP